MTIAGIAIDVKIAKKLASELKDNANANDINVLKYHPSVPPSRSSMFYGRDGLVAELTNLVVNDKALRVCSASRPLRVVRA
ncbi:hypothetical protein DFH29DRAFT_998080 [Suillus ampliporus]|nr:hypothetical protein DFH29DRAFT_998080 [Suillus ampliporus]